MDYYQGIVVDFLRAKRGVFVSPEGLLQLDEKTPNTGRHWYCDVMAADFQARCLYLCEVSYSKTLSALLKRLGSWDSNWSELSAAMHRDFGIPKDWQVAPWAFVPRSCAVTFKQKLPQFVVRSGATTGEMPLPRLTILENVVPWEYPPERTDDRLEELAIA